jgi:hypothetical protein
VQGGQGRLQPPCTVGLQRRGNGQHTAGVVPVGSHRRCMQEECMWSVHVCGRCMYGIGACKWSVRVCGRCMHVVGE